MWFACSMLQDILERNQGIKRVCMGEVEGKEEIGERRGSGFVVCGETKVSKRVHG